MRAAAWAGVVLLAWPTVAAANVAVLYYPGDPGYARARLASQVVRGAAVGAVVTGIAWFVRSRGSNRVAATAVLGTFLVVALLYWGGSLVVIVPPDEPKLPFERFGRRPGPGEVSGEEVTLYAAVGAMVLAAGGVAVARRSVPKREG
ncbi:hypothetical protein [Urbifossiella limnaea]|uniref:Uncharacterized protein n=1 Tax=Urbifossiella limnaea TaxID=2528023 RepID=A0A517XP63_9BACT|nr:hypothetical protein [Urbifossiella limnaea]QDU19295.1 hypothetical protein ETAA1_12010 [Urbifossiella limnaea]